MAHTQNTQVRKLELNDKTERLEDAQGHFR